MAYIPGIIRARFDASSNSFLLEDELDSNYIFLKKIYQSIEKNDYETFVQLYPEYLENHYDYFTYWEPNKGEYIHYYPLCICYQSYNEKEGNLERVHKLRYSLKCNCRPGKKYLMATVAKKNDEILKYIMEYDKIETDLNHKVFNFLKKE